MSDQANSIGAPFDKDAWFAALAEFTATPTLTPGDGKLRWD